MMQIVLSVPEGVGNAGDVNSMTRAGEETILYGGFFKVTDFNQEAIFLQEAPQELQFMMSIWYYKQVQTKYPGMIEGEAYSDEISFLEWSLWVGLVSQADRVPVIAFLKNQWAVRNNGVNHGPYSGPEY